VTEQNRESTELVIPRAFVTRVTTNLKTPGEKPRSFELGPLTLLVGPSGSGKTSLVDSICLALTGESPTRGLGKAAANLKRAMPKEAEALTAEVELSIDEKLVWTLGREDSKAVWPFADGFPLRGSGAVTPAPGTVLSIADALDLLLGYDKNRLLALLEAVPDTAVAVSGIDALVSALGHGLRARLGGVLPSDGQVIAPSEMQRAVRTVSSIGSEFSRVISACEAFRSEGLSNMEEIELSQLEEAFNRQAGTEFLRQQMARGKAQVEAAEAELVGLGRLIEESRPGYAATRAVLLHTLELLQALNARGATAPKCPGCGEPRSPEVFVAREQQLRAGLERADEPVKGYLEQIDYHRAVNADVGARLLAICDLLKQYEAAEPVDAKRLVELRQRKSDATLSLAAASKASTLTREKKQLEALENALLDSAAKALPAAVDIVRRRANTVLPRGRQMHLEVEGRKVHVGQVLHKSSPVPCGALSGSERVILAAAFAIALQPKRQTPVSLLVLDETMMDRKTLKLVLTGLCRALEHDTGPTQVIACAAEWSGKLPAGWISCEVEAPAPAEEKKEQEQPEQPVQPVGELTGEGAQAEGTAGETPADPPPDVSFLADLL